MEDLEIIILQEIKDIWELNGTNRTGALVNGFRIDYEETPEGFIFNISNSQNYFKYLMQGTYDRKDEPQEGFPIIRKYDAIKPQGYPDVLGSYPYDKKGTERIDFAGLLFERLLNHKDDIAKEYIKNIKISLLNEFN